ncbi:uncharacterized protein MYCFIDRAFT_171841 [Pseudocercospora fijiensis CIRAD86]|uniref:Uncharacterized protein n=1 Tax=Pseudocercospora fijiensis (strain CIRAD86) TaxID=383855 RepID=M3B9T3_PSEFD|nr:uncharacterized protein MYCFIDRAFT_171841 [Pseudocercospora fijiensis CIRAD86]EME86018.1 hypothetical protein MYCFIDRAFT_171841 [Pseudocercospora fijiensis CIRAD86]
MFGDGQCHSIREESTKLLLLLPQACLSSRGKSMALTELTVPSPWGSVIVLFFYAPLRFLLSSDTAESRVFLTWQSENVRQRLGLGRIVFKVVMLIQRSSLSVPRPPAEQYMLLTIVGTQAWRIVVARHMEAGLKMGPEAEGSWTLLGCGLFLEQVSKIPSCQDHASHHHCGIALYRITCSFHPIQAISARQGAQRVT